MAHLPKQLQGRLGRLWGRVASRPVALPLGVALPIRAAVSMVVLPPGCRPPPGILGCRMAAGWGATLRDATRTAGLEAAERFSLQYRDGDPDMLAPVPALSTGMAPLPARTLLLGHPGDVGPPVTSVGGAAGIDLADAAGRGLLECLEHAARDACMAGAPTLPVQLHDAPDLASLRAALARHGRRLHGFASAPAPGAVAVTVVCSGPDGGAPAIGSAAGTEVADVCRRAAVEAALLWCNLAAMTGSGVPLDRLGPRERALLAAYLGGWPLPQPPDAAAPRPPADIARALGLPAEPAAPADLLAHWRSGATPRFRSFDLTRPEVGIPVARVTLDAPA